MVKPIGEVLAPLSSDIRVTVSTLNMHMAFILLFFAYLAIFQWRDLLTTRLGNITAVATSLFWFLRGINQVVFYGPTAAGRATSPWSGTKAFSIRQPVGIRRGGSLPRWSSTLESCSRVYDSS
jgi:hypothetical protein